MQVRLLIFGPHAAALGRNALTISVDNQATCDDVLRGALRDHPVLSPLMRGTRLAVNAQFGRPEERIKATDELALIGMVSGG